MIWIGIGAIAGLCSAGVTVVSFWIAFAEKIAMANAKAQAAKELADEAKHDLDNLHTQVGAHIGSFALFREHVAREYVDRDVLSSMEKRIMDGLKDVTQRLDQVLRGRGGQH